MKIITKKGNKYVQGKLEGKIFSSLIHPKYYDNTQYILDGVQEILAEPTKTAFNKERLIRAFTLSRSHLDEILLTMRMPIEEYGLSLCRDLLDYLEIAQSDAVVIGFASLRYYKVHRLDVHADTGLLLKQKTFEKIIKILQEDKEVKKFEIQEYNYGRVAIFFMDGIRFYFIQSHSDTEDSFIENARHVEIFGNKTIPILTVPDYIIYRLYLPDFKDISDVEAIIHNNALSPRDMKYIRDKIQTLYSKQHIQLFDKIQTVCEKLKEKTLEKENI